MLAALGIFALSATAAQAGSGGGIPASLNTFFECHPIISSAANPDVLVRTCDPGSNCDSSDGLITDKVKVGIAAFVCKQVDVQTSPGSAPLDPDPSDLIKCYNITRSGQKGSAVDQHFTDVFTTETNGVSDQPGFLCAPVKSP
jgi:hypothetical protein